MNNNCHIIDKIVTWLNQTGIDEIRNYQYKINQSIHLLGLKNIKGIKSK